MFERKGLEYLSHELKEQPVRSGGGACLMNDILDRNHPPHEQIVVGKGRNTLPQASGQPSLSIAKEVTKAITKYCEGSYPFV